MASELDSFKDVLWYPIEDNLVLFPKYPLSHFTARPKKPLENIDTKTLKECGKHINKNSLHKRVNEGHIVMILCE